jgi:hypothetical protein
MVSEKITNACGEFMEALGFEYESEEEPIFNSFWQKLKFGFSRHVSVQELDGFFSKGKKALELKHVELPTAEQTEKLAGSAQKIASTLEKYEEGVVRLGCLLVLKITIKGEAKLIIQQLNFKQVKYFEANPAVLKNLKTVYLVLNGEIDIKKLADESEDREEAVTT